MYPFDVSGWKEYENVNLAFPQDQKSCGSCWAIACATASSDRARKTLQSLRHGVPVQSPLFTHQTFWTGYSGTDGEKPTEMTSLNGFSAYYLLAFAPKLAERCDDDACLVPSCSQVFDVDQTVSSVQLASRSASNDCRGCTGNNLEMPFRFLTEHGAPMETDFGLGDWMWLSDGKMKEYARQTWSLQSSLAVPSQPIPVFRATRFMVADTTQSMPFKSMEHWMMNEIVHYGPIVVGLNAVPSLHSQFTYSKNPQTNMINDAVFLPTDSSDELHAVSVVGFGVDSTTGKKYWTVRNSWSSRWNGNGYFRVHRGVNCAGIENEFAASYFDVLSAIQTHPMVPQVVSESLRRQQRILRVSIFSGIVLLILSVALLFYYRDRYQSCKIGKKKINR